ncbi:MAG: tRNA (adenosine(37)-N6)-threonylcarbamoyltransferase complex ATPase subunit type 1 TsaE [Bacteroidales bacterium]|nr:tRNA (adenosine(37)-N6)-threonylcarbamoyltransferase complex ATPase subunit type 1 TsaE [Bacteroidales bacterium]
MAKITIENINQINRAAKEFINLTANDKIFLFKGEMGSGKTTFIKAICSELGVSQEVTSPTFAIVNEYETSRGQQIYHFDLYRIDKIEELLDIGFEEYLNSDALIFIEWPELAENIIHEPTLTVNIIIAESGKREISF